MRVAAGLSVLLALALGASPAVAGTDGTLGVYADASATQSSAVFSIGVPRTLFVIARLEGATANGMTQAEFRIDGLPDDWFVFVTPNPAANVVLGDPFRPTGSTHRANIVFPSCAAGSSGRVLLYTAVVVANSEIEPRDLTIEVGNPPTNPNFTTPILVRCDAPEFTSVAATSEPFHMEVRAPQDLDYSALPGFDSLRGVVPLRGSPGDLFHFRVAYSSSDGQLPAPGSPWLELDLNGDEDTDDPGEGRFSTLPADLDSTLTNGKDYRFDVALGAPPEGRYRYRFTAVDHHGAPVPGAATVWRDSLFVTADFAELGVNAEDIRIIPSHPAVNEICAIIARIENRGVRRVSGAVVRIEDVFGNPIAEHVLSNLGPNATTEVACTWRFEDPGFQPVVVRVDPGNQIFEGSEVDNVASHAVFVGGPSVTGTMSFTGLPLLVTVPPVAPFGLFAGVLYNVGALPPATMRGGLVHVRPSWEEATSVRTDGVGSFAVGLVPPAVPGAYSIVFEATDGARLDSRTVQLQVTPLADQSPPHEPNLALRLTLDAAPGCPATHVVLNATVENDGNDGSDATQVRILAADLTTVATIDVGALSPGAILALDPVLVPITGPGPHHFTAHVDPASTIRELREDDNIATADGRTQSLCFDLALASMGFTGTRICATEPIPIVARVENLGCVASQPSRVAWMAGGIEIGTAPLPVLGAGEIVEINLSHVFSTADCQDLELVLDPDGTAGLDCDAENSRLGAGACPGACGPPPPPLLPNFSIEACDIAASNPRPAPGEPIRFRATVRNLGQANSTGPIHVGFAMGATPLGGQVTIVAIPAGESRTVETPTTWPVSFVPQLLTVTIDTHGQPNTGDSVQRGVPWDLRPLPLGTCPPSQPPMFSTCSPCQGTPVQINAVVMNDGLFDCDSVLVHFRENRPGGALLGAAWAADVLAGACNAAGVPVSIQHAFFGFGLQPVQVALDPLSVLAETNEANNTYSRDVNISCGAAPDLVARVRLPAGPSPAPGDTVRAVEVEVENIGQAVASDVQARLWLDGVPLCDLEMGTLAPGIRSTVVCTTPWVAAAGCSQRLQACADPNSRIGELNETNNCGTTGLSGNTLTDLALTAFGITITPPNPAPFQPVLIKVSLYSHRGVESRCRFLAEWSANGNTWSPFQDFSLQIPANIFLIPDALQFTWLPPDNELYLRFSLVEVCPTDANPHNNVALGSLPWFVAPGTPVTVSDFEATSTAEGVLLQWSVGEPVDGFVLERRTDDESEWHRLPATLATSNAVGKWEALDRDAPPQAPLEYRLLARVDGEEEIAATLTVTHSAASRLFVLHGARPQPFRAGGAIEFTLPETRTVELGVFDAAGRRVRSLWRGAESAGRHGVSWDGRDDQGARLPAGVYFCRLVSGTLQQTQRLVLVH